jgi:hypothetical protein
VATRRLDSFSITPPIRMFFSCRFDVKSIRNEKDTVKEKNRAED